MLSDSHANILTGGCYDEKPYEIRELCAFS